MAGKINISATAVADAGYTLSGSGTITFMPKNGGNQLFQTFTYVPATGAINASISGLTTGTTYTFTITTVQTMGKMFNNIGSSAADQTAP